MIDYKAGEEAKLKQARELWEQALDHYEDSLREKRLAARFYHNTERNGQWDKADREFLEEEGRPVLSFNVTKGKVDGVAGMIEDVRQRPVPKAVGAEDTFAATIHMALLDRVRELTATESLEWEATEKGLVRGDYNIAFDAAPDPKNPANVEMTMTLAGPHEIKWDFSSERPGREDAQWFFWDKWLTVAEFKAAYPEHADDAETLLKGGEDEDPDGFHDQDGPFESAAGLRGDRDYDDQLYTQYFDRKRRRIRVIHCEYKVPIKRHHLVHVGSGQSEPVPTELVSTVKALQEAGATPDMVLVEIWDEEIYWLDFCRKSVLFDDLNPLPTSGFSVVPFTCFFDDVDHTTYGVVRNLIDPQLEINKSYSQKLEHVVEQSKPGYIAEQGAVPDQDQFERSLNEGGGVSYVSDGSIAGNRIIPRPPAQLPVGAQERHANSLELLDRISGFTAEMEHAGGGNEALGTVQLRYRKSQVALRNIFNHYAVFQKELARKQMEIVLQGFPDHQIQSMLSNPSLVVQDGMVLQLGPPDEMGQPSIAQQLSLRDMRATKFDIDLETTTANNTLRILDLQNLAQLVQLQVPIDPSVLVEKATASRGDRERLLAFVRQSQQSQAQSQQMEAQTFAQQMERGFAQQQSELAEERRHNIAEESIKARGQQMDLSAKFAAILERADANERQMIQAERARADAQANTANNQGRTTNEQ